MSTRTSAALGTTVASSPPRTVRRRSAAAALAVVALLASVLALATARPAAAAPPQPEAALAVSPDGFIGDTLQFTVSFDNADTTAPGYGPFIDLFLPASGTDGDDGISFGDANYLGAAVTSTVVPITACPISGHPYLPGTVACPTGFGVGDQLVVLELPFGSFTPGQPTADITVNSTVSNLADDGVPLDIAARAGFRYGDSATGSTPIVQAPAVVATHTPELLRLTKRYLGPEDETATGPNFPRQYELVVEIAPGQTIDALTLTDLLPNNLVYTGIDSTTPGGGTVVTEPPSTTVPHNSPDNELEVNVGSVVGTGGEDAVLRFDFFIPQLDADGDAVIDPSSGDDVESRNEAMAEGIWDPIDTRDGSDVAVSAGDADNPEHILDDKSIAIQKSVAIVNEVGADGASPGDTLRYTLDFQVSDFFTFGGVTATDVFTDGQTLSSTPTITFSDDDDDITGSFDTGDYTVVRADSPCGDGSTQIDFRISDAIVDLGSGDVPLADGILTGGLALGGDTGATTGTISFETTIDSNYACLDDGNPLDSNDSLTNDVTIAGEVLDNVTQSSQTVPQFEDDDSAAGVDIVAGSLDKYIYARNDTLPADPDDPEAGLATLTQFAPGDSITYRLTSTEPLTNVEQLSLVDYLPLPVLAVPTTVPFDTSANPTGALPAIGGARFGPLDTFSAATGVNPTTSTDALANSVSFDYGDYQADPGTDPETIDILFRLPISDDPFVDGLFLTNQVRKFFDNSFQAESFLDDIIQIDLTQPALRLTKGVVASDNDEATFAPGTRGPVSFTDPVGSPTAPRWGGAITSNGLAATPINSNISGGVDAGDLVTFAVTVENQGRGLYGAFNVELADSIPAGYEIPSAADLNLQVTDGAGNALPFTDLGGGFFGSGIRLDDTPAAGPDHEQGALAPFDESSGANIAVVTYNLRLDHVPDADTVQANQLLTNTATLARYSSTSTGPNFVPGGVTDPATVRTATPLITKTITGTDQLHTAGNDVAIGEQVSYEVRVRVPEGEHPNFTVTDTLDTGLSFVSFDGVAFDPAAGSLSTSLPSLSDAIDPGNVAVTPTDTGQAGAGRIASFDFGTMTNTDDDNSTDEEIVLTYTVVTLNTAGNQNADPTRLNNRVQTNYGGSRGAPNVSVVEPAVQVDKTVNPTEADAGDRITFTLEVSNLAADGADATAFDVALDDMVPAGFTLVPGSFTHDAGLAPTTGPDETGAPLLVAGWDAMPVGSTSTFTFDADIDANIDESALAAGLTNTARVRSTSLPEDGPPNSSSYNAFGVERTGDPTDPGGSANNYVFSDDATVELPDPVITKALLDTSEGSTPGSDVTIGEVATYRLLVTLPEGEISDFNVTDQLPAGLAYMGGTVSVLTSSPALVEDFGGTLGASTITPTGDGASGQDLELDFGATTVTAGNPYDNSFVVEFDALVLDVTGNRGDDPATGADEGTVLTNTAEVTVAGNTGTSGPVDVTVVEPIMAITKTFEPGAAAANDTVTVRLAVENVGDAVAFDVNVDDLLEGDYFPAGDISEGTTPSGFSYSTGAEGDNDTRVTYSGGDIAIGETVEFTFQVILADPLPIPGSVTNTATVIDATTLPATHPGGEGDERNEPDVSDQDVLTFTAPELRVVKNDGVQVRTPGELFSYTITVFNDGGRDATGVALTDTLPAGLSFALASNGGSETAPGSGVITWPTFDLAAGADREFTLAVTVDGPLPEPITEFLNAVEVTDDGTHGTDPNLDDNSDTDLDTADTVVDIGVVKDDGEQTRTAGEQFTYSLTVTNHGNQGESGIDLTDTLPANTSFVSASDGGTETAPDSGVVTWPAFALDGAGGATDEVTYTVTVLVDNPLPAGVESLVNNATVDSPDDANADNNNDSDTDVVDATPDLTVTKDDGISQAAPGDTITYSIDIANVGTQAATGVTVTDTLPDGVSFVSATDGGDETAPGSGVVTWSIASLGGLGGTEPNTATVTVTVTVDDPIPTGQSELINTVIVGDDGDNGPDPTPDDNVDTDVDALVPDLRIVKNDGVQNRTPDEAFTYTLTVFNDGGVTATGVEISDTLPAELEYVSASGTGTHSGEPTGGTVTWDPVSVDGGSSTSVTVTVRVVDPIANDLTQIVNSASVEDDGSNGPDPTPDNNTDTDTDNVSGTIDLAVSKDDGTQTRTPGEQYSYTITVANVGDRDAVDAVVTDTLPAGLGFVSASDGGTETAPGSRIVTWPAFPLGGAGNPSGSETTRTVTVLVDDPVAAGVDSLRNDVTVAAPGDDNSSNDSDTDVDVLDAAPDLTVTKDDGLSVVTPGDTLTYDVVVTNVGDQEATGVVATDTLPANTTFVSATDGGAETAPGSGIVTWGPFALDGSGGVDSTSFSVTVTVDSPLPQPTTSVTNVVTVADDGTNGADPTPENNRDIDTDLTVTDVRIEKNDGVQTRNPGEEYTYTLDVYNDGGVEATGVTVTDTLPDDVIFVAASGTGAHDGSPLAGDVTWDPFTIDGGDSVTVTVTVRLRRPVPNGTTDIVNNVVVTHDETFGPDPTPDNNADSDLDSTESVIDLGIVKDDGVQTRNPGDTFDYTLTVTNHGDEDAVDAIVTDTLPANTTFVSATGGGAETAPGSGIVTWGPFDLGGDGHVDGNVTELTVTVLIDNPVPGGVEDIVNTATVEAPGDVNDLNNEDSDTDILDATPDLTVTKDDGESVIAPGDSLTYDVVVTNVGDQEATGVVATDTLPANTTFVSATDGGVETAPGSGIVTWGPFALDGSGGVDSTSFSVTVTVDSPLPQPTTSVTNVVTVEDDGTNGADPTPENNRDIDTDLTVTDVRIEKNDGVQTRNPGEEYTYTLDVYNDGGVEATGVTVTDTLPDDVIFVAASGTGAHDGSPLAGDVTWDPFTIDGGDSVTVTVTVRLRRPVPNGTTDIVNNVVVTHDETFGPDPTPDNNADSDLDSTESVIDLGIVKDDGVQTRNPGDTFDYTLTVTNHGDEDAVDAIVTDTLPANTTFVSATGGGAETAPGSGIVTWGPFDLGGDGHVDGNVTELTVTVLIDNPVPGGVEDIVNTATVEAPGDVNDLNNEDSDTDILDATPDLTVTKDDGQTTAVEGETLTYTVTVTNVGDQEATGTTITDVLPVGVTFVSASDGGTESTPGIVTWPLVDLPGAGGSGNEIIRTVTVTVDQPLPEGTVELINTVTVGDDGANGPDPTPEDNSDTDVDATGADLSVTKTDNQFVATPGEALVYDIVVTNAGPETLDRIQLDETLPDELTDVTFETSEGTYDVDTGAWTGIDLTADDTIVLTVTGTVRPEARGTVVNTVAVSSPDHADPTPDDNEDTDVDPLLPEFDLSIDKRSVGVFERGAQGTYRLTVTNDGPSAAGDVELVDDLPDGLSFVDVDAPAGWTCDHEDGTVTCRHPEMFLPGSSSVFDLTVLVADDAPDEIDNIATVSSNDDDIDGEPTIDDEDDDRVAVVSPSATTEDPDSDTGQSGVLPRTGASVGGLLLLALGLLVCGRVLQGRRSKA